MQLRTNPKAEIDGYFSHPIRGAKGNKATPEEMETNCRHCRIIAHSIVKRFPKVDLYVPADHDEFVSDAFQNGILTDTQILKVDCMILAKRKFIMVYNPHDFISNGMSVEIQYAIKHNIPQFFFTKNNAGTRKRFAAFIERLLEV